MPVTSTIVVLDPVDPYEVSAAAAGAAGLPAPSHGWDLVDMGALNILQTDGELAGIDEVSVRFGADGGRIPGEDEQDDPLLAEGYALVRFTTAGRAGPAGVDGHHEQLIRTLGAWLTGRALRWSWQYDDGPWVAGPPRPVSARPGPVHDGRLRLAQPARAAGRQG
jgi:hypothetical protein